MQPSHKDPRHYIDKKLLFRLRIYFVIVVILLGIVLFEIMQGRGTIRLSLIGLLMGLIIGVFVTRMHHFSWDEDVKKVISQMDYFGVIVLVLYVVVVLLRTNIISHLVARGYVTSTSLAVTLGVMIGRIWGTRYRIITLLKEKTLPT